MVAHQIDCTARRKPYWERGTRAVGTSRGTADELDYHNGVASQTLLSARLNFDGTAALDITAREYYVTHSGITRDRGYDNIARVDASLTWRVWHQHAFAIKYLHSRRDESFPELGERRQSAQPLACFTRYLGKTVSLPSIGAEYVFYQTDSGHYRGQDHKYRRVIPCATSCLRASVPHVPLNSSTFYGKTQS